MLLKFSGLPFALLLNGARFKQLQRAGRVELRAETEQ